jgi:hypothetical protein
VRLTVKGLLLHETILLGVGGIDFFKYINFSTRAQDTQKIRKYSSIKGEKNIPPETNPQKT